MPDVRLRTLIDADGRMALYVLSPEPSAYVRIAIDADGVVFMRERHGDPSALNSENYGSHPRTVEGLYRALADAVRFLGGARAADGPGVGDPMMERCACGHTKADHLDEAGMCDGAQYCCCERYVPAGRGACE